MRRLLVTLAVNLCLLTTLHAQAPITYSQADPNDQAIYPPTQYGIPSSFWLDSTGHEMGTQWCFPSSPYKGICIWRLTDASVFGGATAQTPEDDADGNTAQTADDQRDDITSALSGTVRYIIARSTGEGLASWIR